MLLLIDFLFPLYYWRLLVFKGVVDCFFSRLDCVYGVPSSMCSCLVFLKTHYFSHNLPLFHTSLSLLWQTLDLFPGFMKLLLQKIRDGLRLVSWLSVLWLAKPPLLHWTSRPAPLLSGMCSGWIVNSGVVYNAYLWAADWDPEDISEEDRAEPVQAQLLMVCLVVVVSYFLNTLLFVSATAPVSFNIRFYPD